MKSSISTASSSSRKSSTTRPLGDLPDCVLAVTQLGIYHTAPGEKGVSNWMAPIDKCIKLRPLETLSALISTAVLGLVAGKGAGRGLRKVAISH